MMTNRKALSKGLRFDIFKRDAFTCQYCGRQPPEVVLQIDHIRPISEGGDNDPLNLVTACEECNRGKGRKLLERPQRPDADLAWLETQQEIAELRRYQQAEQERDKLMAEAVRLIQDTFHDVSGFKWCPADTIVMQMLRRNSPREVEEALCITASRLAGGILDLDEWLRYTHGILKHMREDNG